MSITMPDTLAFRINSSYYKALVAYSLRDFDNTMYLLHDVVRRSEELEWDRAKTYANTHIARIYILSDRLNESNTLLNRCYEESKRRSDQRSLGHIRQYQGELALRRGDSVSALEYFQKSVRRFSRIGMKFDSARVEELIKTL